MTIGKWSENEPSFNIESVDDLDRYDFVEAKSEVPTAISIEIHGYRVDLLVGHETSFVHMTPDDPARPYRVTVGGPTERGRRFLASFVAPYVVRESPLDTEDSRP